MSGKKGMRHVAGMRHRRKGGREQVPVASTTPLQQSIDRWIGTLAARDYSPRTFQSYRWSAEQFGHWVGERGIERAEDVTKPMLESYQRWLYRYRTREGRPLNVKSRRDRIRHVQQLFAWLCRGNELPANPAADLELPRLIKALHHKVGHGPRTG